jgi:hypothetical protein
MTTKNRNELIIGLNTVGDGWRRLETVGDGGR